MTSITGRLADFVAGTTYQGLPDGVAARAKLLVMDALGIAVRARHEAGSTPSLLAAVDKLGLGRGSASVIGDEAGYAPPAAALINGNPFMLKSSRQRGGRPTRRTKVSNLGSERRESNSLVTLSHTTDRDRSS